MFPQFLVYYMIRFYYFNFVGLHAFSMPTGIKEAKFNYFIDPNVFCASIRISLHNLIGQHASSKPSCINLNFGLKIENINLKLG